MVHIRKNTIKYPGIRLSLIESRYVDARNARPMYGATIVLGWPMPQHLQRIIRLFQGTLQRTLRYHFTPHELDALHLTVCSVVLSQNTYGEYKAKWNEVAGKTDLASLVKDVSRDARALPFRSSGIFVGSDGNVILKVENIDGQLMRMEQRFAQVLRAKHQPSNFGYIVIGKISFNRPMGAHKRQLLEKIIYFLNLEDVPDFTLDRLTLVEYNQRNLWFGKSFIKVELPAAPNHEDNIG